MASSVEMNITDLARPTLPVSDVPASDLPAGDVIQGVKAWREDVTIPTYPVGAPNPNPMFLDKRVYQGSSGAVYPHAVIDSVGDEKSPQTYSALFLENAYLKIMLLPELGGRVHMAYDKTNDYHFVYFNRVIKPALVGLTGPWISGGIEFNWPQHHRPSTFSPVEWHIEEHEDGSKTAWLGEVELMFRTKGMAGFRLYPDRAFLEIRGQLYNRTELPQTFLWWANPAVAVNEHYQSVFPPDVVAVMDHGKRDVSRFPIATGEYYKADYSAGVDISWYKNIPVPTSYMAYHSDYDFVGGYDHGRQAGLLHVANHHISPGKKQWTWGHGDFGQAWDRNLTDEDGPYVELMTGVFTDNQPDFSWIQPGEEKQFVQVFMPYKSIGLVKNATRDVAVALERTQGGARIGVYVTSPQKRLRILLRARGNTVHDKLTDLDPTLAYQCDIPLPLDIAEDDLELSVFSQDRLLVDYRPRPASVPELPHPAQAASPPHTIGTTEELYLTGLHLEQYRHATYDAEAYYREGLRRDEGDSRLNNALGLLLLRRGCFEAAEGHFRRSITRLTSRNPNPYDGEPHYNLGCALRHQCRFEEAFAAFYKATWNAAWQGPAFFVLAQLAARAGRLEESIDLTKQCLDVNGRHRKARHLLITNLRRTNQVEAAIREASAALVSDPLDAGVSFELSSLQNASDARLERLRDKPATLIELCLDYRAMGDNQSAERILSMADASPHEHPLLAYHRGSVAEALGDRARCHDLFAQAALARSTTVFAHRLEDLQVLNQALTQNPQDAQAAFQLGNLLYAKNRRDEAIHAWEQARQADDSFATVHRNLGLGYFNHRKDPDAALASFERAFAADPTDARILFELDQLRSRLGVPPEVRLLALEAHRDVVFKRDDLTTEWVTVLNLAGRADEALQLMQERRFHPWEGGEGKITRQYVASLTTLALCALGDQDFSRARELLEQALHYPDNLGEGMLPTTSFHQTYFLLALSERGLARDDERRAHLTNCCAGSPEPTAAQYYNDQPPENVFFQGLALRELGDESAARARFNRLISYAEKHWFEKPTIDYFAVSLPDFLVFVQDMATAHHIHCRFLRSLGLIGLGRHDEAEKELEELRRTAPHHFGAAQLRQVLAVLS